MHVIGVGNMYPPHSFGGYENVWQAAVEHLRSKGHEVTVVTTDVRTGDHGADPPHVHRELRWHLEGGEFRALGPRERLALARHNAAVLDRHLADGADVVMWWSMGGLTLSLLEQVRRRGIPAVAFVHDDWLDYGRYVDPWLSRFTGPRRSRLAPVASRLTGIPASVDFARAARYVFVSEHTRDHALERAGRLPDTGVAHSGIHEAFLDPAPVRPWSWRLLYVGRLDARKGVHTAVEALAHLPAEATLDVAGGWDDAEERRLRDLAGDLGVADRVNFLGHRGRDDLVAAYGDCDVAVFPVVWEEPWGLVPLEAMARGRPVVATGRGGSKEYLRDGANCLLFEAEDPAALAAAVRRLAGDEGLRARLREGGLATAPAHTEAALNGAVEREVTRMANGSTAPETALAEAAPA